MNIYIVNAFVWMLEFTSPGSLLRHFVLLVSSRSSMKSKELCRTPWRWGPDMNLAVETEALTFMWTWHVSSIAHHCARLWWKCLSHNLSRRSLRYATKVNKKVSRRSSIRCSFDSQEVPKISVEEKIIRVPKVTETVVETVVQNQALFLR